MVGGSGCRAGVAAGMPGSGGPELHLQAAAAPRPARRLPVQLGGGHPAEREGGGGGVAA